MPTGVYVRKRRKAIIPIGPSIAYIPLTRGFYALIDRENAEWLEKYAWRVHFDEKSRNFYARTNEFHAETGRYMTRSMHSLILGLKGRKITADHISPKITLDNRRCNLRTATQSLQNRNQTFSGESGMRGVTRSRKVWRARMRIGGKKIHLGSFPTPELARIAYLEAMQRILD